MNKLFARAFIIAFTFLFLSCQSNKMTSVEFSDGNYKGEIDKKGKKSGNGFYEWHDGSTYQGDYKDDFRHGNGLFHWSNGESYKGDYLEDERTGMGTYRWPDGSFYEGSFLKGKRHGSGLYQSINGLIYEGKWFDDLQHGEGKLTNPNGSVVLGVWRNGKMIIKPSPLPNTATKPNLAIIDIPSEPTTKLDRSIIKPSPPTFPTPLQREIPDSPEKDNQSQTETISSKQESISNSEKNILEQSGELPTEFIANEINYNSRETQPIQPRSEQVEIAETPIKTSGVTNIWTGTVAEAEDQFVTDLIDGIDTVSYANTKIPFSGKMQILNQVGSLIGEVNLLDGKLHGEEIFIDETGAITERNIWEKGVRK